MCLLLMAIVIAGPLVACQAPPAPQAATAAPTTAPAKPTTAATTAATVAPAAAATAVPTVAPVATAAAGAAPVAGTYTGPLAKDQVLRLYLSVSDPPSLDPSKVEDTSSVAVLNAIYATLTRYRPDLSVEPGVASSWDFSADGKTITFKLRPSKWSDGTAVTAKDFEYSWKRLLDPRTGSPYASILADDVVGAAEFNSAKVPTDTAKLPQLEAAVGVKAVDDSTFQVTLKGAASYFLAIAAQAILAPINRAAVEKGGDKWAEPPNHISNGPFKLTSWKHGSQIVLEPNPNYFGDKPTLTRIEYSIIADQKAALEAYKNNEIDVDFDIPQADRPTLEADPNLSKEIQRGNQLATYYIGFNVSKAPLDGEKGKLVRQALSQAIDRATLVKVVNKGVGSPAMSFLPPGMLGHQANVGFKFDPAAAKATLQKAGYADGAALGTVTLMYNTSATHKPILEFVADQIKTNLGVTVDIQNIEWASYLALLRKDAPHMWRMGWNADYPHPNNFFANVFASTGSSNYTNWKNPQFDKLVTDASREPDQKKQEQLYNQAQQILVDEAPGIFLYFYGRFVLVKPWIKDLIYTSKDETWGDYFWRLTKIAQH